MAKQSQNENDSVVTLPGTQKDLEQMLKDEKSRVSFMENVIKGMYQKKVTIGQGTISIELTPAELSQLINAESQLFDLRRKVNGVMD